MSDAYVGQIRDADGGGWAERASQIAVGVALLSALFAAANVLNWVTAADAFGGVHLYLLYGIGLVVTGALTAVVGSASAAGVVETHANRTTGAGLGLLAGLEAFVAVGLVVSQTLGSGTVGWLLSALVVGVVVFVVVALAPEDLGATLPWAALAVLVGAVFLTGIISPDWKWAPKGFGFAFTGTITIPVLTFVVSLSAAWAAAKGSQGFGARGRQLGAYLLIGTSAFFMVSLLVLLVLFVVEKGAGRALKGAHLGPGLSVHVPFVTNGSGLGVVVKGVFPALVGTFWLVLGALVLSVPLSVGAAIFLSEYAEQGRFTTVVDIATDGLWSTPSIVYGLFGYAFLVPRLGGRPSLLAGQLVLGFMLLPLVLITSREAINSVPDAYRDASIALGVNRWQTVRSVVLPAALPGILTGVILGVGRIAGETAPLILVAAGGLNDNAVHVVKSFHFTSTPPFVANDALLSATNALPYQVYAVIEAGVGGSTEFGWATAFLLLVVVICFYAVGIASRLYFQRKLRQ